MKILFILPRFNKGFGTVYNENETGIDYDYLMPVGMPYIASYLKHHGYDVAALNLNHTPGLIKDIVQKTVTDTHYDFVFTGTISIMYPAVRDIIKYVREASPDTITVCGGGIISSNPELMMKLINPHYGIIFEGEETALELVQTIERGQSVEDVKGIAYNSCKYGDILWPSTIIRINKPRPQIKNLDALPFPDLELFGYSEYLKYQELGGWNQYPRDYPPRPYMLVSARGCSHFCRFCFHTTGPKYRYRSVENIMSEIKYVVEKYHINFFTFLDELFSYDKARALEFCRQFKEYQKTIPWRIEMYCNLRVDCADAEILDAMKSCGNIVIGLGLESYNQTVLDSMRKHITPTQIKTTLEMIAERNLVPQGGFIFGDSAETLSTARETLDFIRDNPHLSRGGLFMGFIIPFPGTAIYKDALKKGIIRDETEFINKLTSTDYNYDNVYNFTSLSDKDFDKLKDEVFTLKYTAIPVSVPWKIETHSIQGETEIKTLVCVKCPHCGEIQSYKTTKLPHAQFSVGVICNDCNGRFEMGTRYIQLGRLAVKLLGFKRMRQIKNWMGI